MTKHCLKAVALFYGVTLILSGVGMAAYCLVAEQPFAMPADMPVVLDLRAFYLTAGLIMSVGLGSVLLWAGIGPKTRTGILRASIRLGRAMLE
ncbi:MAG: hypothetical protein MK179_14975 [Pirellulaceae bacterium]|nr:hypothetical protein [Pirellulaceae bacterium]